MQVCIVIKDTTKLFFLISLLSKVNTLVAQKFDNVNNVDFITKLINIIKDDDVEKYLLTNNGLEPIHSLKYKNGKYDNLDKNQDLKREFNTVLVKRLVPHNYEANPYEYDEKFNTFYKPLVRIHGNEQRRPVFLTDNAILKNNRIENKFLKQSDNFEILSKVNPNDIDLKDAYLFQPFKLNMIKKVTPQNILKDVKSYVRGEDDIKKIRALKYAILGALENKPKLKLRSIVHMPPGKIDNRPIKVHLDELVQLQPDSSTQWGSHNYWNYWTYNKPIHQDACKGKLVQWGNICIETPPH